MLIIVNKKKGTQKLRGFPFYILWVQKSQDFYVDLQHGKNNGNRLRQEAMWRGGD